MFKHYFEQIDGIAFYPLLSLVIFVAFFVSLLIWVLRVSKGYVQEMSHLPLHDEQPSSTRRNNS